MGTQGGRVYKLNNFNKIKKTSAKAPHPTHAGPVFALNPYRKKLLEGKGQEKKPVSQILKDIFQRYFKFYLIFCVLGFIILVLLMNLPGVLAGEATSLPSENFWQSKSTPAFPEEKIQILPSKFYRWQLPVSHNSTDPDYFMEMRMNRMVFKMRF